MAKHKSICWIISILVFIGALNWGLVGLGSFLKTQINLLNLIFGSVPQLEWAVYLLIGVAGLVYGYLLFTSKDCACNKK